MCVCNIFLEKFNIRSSSYNTTQQTFPQKLYHSTALQSVLKLPSLQYMKERERCSLKFKRHFLRII